MTEKVILNKKLYKWAGRIYHYCPACNECHPFKVEGKQENGASWTYNDNHESPTFSPSMLIRTGCAIPGSKNDVEDCAMCAADGEYGSCGVCHYFIRAGQIEYCGDSTHKLAGLRVPLSDIPARLL